MPLRSGTSAETNDPLVAGRQQFRSAVSSIHIFVFTTAPPGSQVLPNARFYCRRHQGAGRSDTSSKRQQADRAIEQALEAKRVGSGTHPLPSLIRPNRSRISKAPETAGLWLPRSSIYPAPAVEREAAQQTKRLSGRHKPAPNKPRQSVSRRAIPRASRTPSVRRSRRGF